MKIDDLIDAARVAYLKDYQTRFEYRIADQLTKAGYRVANRSTHSAMSCSSMDSMIMQALTDDDHPESRPTAVLASRITEFFAGRDMAIIKTMFTEQGWTEHSAVVSIVSDANIHSISVDKTPTPDLTKAFLTWFGLPDDFEFPTEQARTICMEILPQVIGRFLERNADYGDNARELGRAGQFADIWRKVRKLRKAWWDGDKLTGEQPPEIAEDMIGHLLLALYFGE